MQSEIKSNFEKSLSEGNFSSSEKDIKEKNFNKFIEQGFPNKRIEDWKFSDLNQIISTNFENLNFSKIDEQPNVDLDFIHEFEHNKIVFINGKLEKIDFSYEEEDKIQIDESSKLENKIENNNSLIDLNSAFTNKICKILIKKNYSLKKPLIIYHLLNNEIKSKNINSRLYFQLEENSS